MVAESNFLSVSVREAAEPDFQGIEKLFEGHGKRPGWAVWKYLECPDGRARVFVAEGPDESIVGTLAYLPRRFTSVDTGPLTVMQTVDIFVIVELRTQGVFLRLLEYSRRHIDGPKMGVPNDSSAVFAFGLGWKALRPYETWQFPVLAGQHFAGKAAELIAPVVNALSGIYKLCWLPGSARNLEMKRITRFDKEFTLDPAVIHGLRSACYLNWRFVDNPEGNYSVYEFIEAGESVGYCVLTRAGSTAILSDFIAARCRRRFLRLLVDQCRAEGITRLNFSGAGLRLRALGFIRRRQSRLFSAIGVPEGKWFVTKCDVDSEPGRSTWESTSLADQGTCT
jgi:hypothetical protein